ARAARPAGPAEAGRGAGGAGGQELGADAEPLHRRRGRHLPPREPVRGALRAAGGGHGQGGVKLSSPCAAWGGGGEADGGGGADVRYPASSWRRPMRRPDWPPRTAWRWPPPWPD